MNKKHRIILFTIGLLILSTVYTYGAAGQSSLNTYKQPLSALLMKTEAVFVNVQKQQDQQLQREVTQIKEQREQAIKLYVTQEKVQAIKEIESYKINLKRQIATLNLNSAVVRLDNYKEKKQAEIAEEINSEIIDYISEIVSNQ